MASLKQILGTKNRKQQEEKVEDLIGYYNFPIGVLTILIGPKGPQFTVTGDVAPELAIRALDVVRDQIVVAQAQRKEQEQQATAIPVPPVDLEETIYPPDYEVDGTLPPEVEDDLPEVVGNG